MSLITHSFAESKPYPWYLVQYEPDEHKCIRQIAPKELLMWNMETSFYDSVRKQDRSAKEHVILYNTNGDACCTYIIQYAKSWDEVVMQQNKLHMFVVEHFGNSPSVTEENISEYGEWVLLSYFGDFTKTDLCGEYTGISYGVYHRSKVVFMYDETTATVVPAIHDLGFLHKVHIIELSDELDVLINFIKLMRSVNISWVELIEQQKNSCLSSLLFVVDSVDILRNDIQEQSECLSILQNILDDYKRDLLVRIMETKSRLVLQHELTNMLLAATPNPMINTQQRYIESMELHRRMRSNIRYLEDYFGKHADLFDEDDCSNY